MRELSQTLMGAKVIKGCDGVKVMTLGAGVDDWDPADPRADIESYLPGVGDDV